jgi:hypothetical protein
MIPNADPNIVKNSKNENEVVMQPTSQRETNHP